MLTIAIETLAEKSDQAVLDGNAFPGFMGYEAEDFSKECLIMLLNVLYNDLQKATNTEK